MHYSRAHCHPPPYYPVHNACGCGSYHQGAVYAYPSFYYPAYSCTPHAGSYAPHAKERVVETEEISADSTTTSASGLIGGSSEVHLTLEYISNSPPSTPPSVKVTITTDGATSTWEETTIPDGYHVKSDFIAVAPGSKITLEVNEATARLRWCETLCC